MFGTNFPMSVINYNTKLPTLETESLNGFKRERSHRLWDPLIFLCITSNDQHKIFH